MAGQPDEGRGREDRTGSIRVAIGLVVFLVGILLIIFVFVQAYSLLNTVDVRIAELGAKADSPNPGGSHATPGPTLGQVALGIGLRIGILVALGFLAGLVSTQGVRMIAARVDRA